jgi:integrase
MSKFTQAFVDKFKAPAGKLDHIEWDDAMPGFGLRVQAKGSRVFVVQYKYGDKQRRISLGKVGKVTLRAAQDTAQQFFAQISAKTSDPASDRKKATTAASKTFDLAMEDFIAYQTNRVVGSYLADITLTLRERCKSLHGLALAEIDLATIAATLRKIAKAGPVSADRRRAHLSKFFSWAIGEGLIESGVNPVKGTNKAAGEYEPRDRLLTADEIKKIWHALGDDDYGCIAKLLILTGTRLNEIGKLRWSEVDLENAVITLPGARTKNGRKHLVPLSKQALAILKSRPRVGDRDFVFGRSSNGFSGWSKCKERLDAKLDLPGWTFHDFRRAFSTIAHEELDVAPHVIEEVLNHRTGTKSGVAAVYNLAKFERQKREALDLYGKYIADLVGPKLRVVA